MATLYTQQDANVRRTWALMTLFFVVIVAVGWAVSYLYDAPEFLVVAVLVSIGMNVMSYWYSDTIALSISRARPASREEFFDLYTVTENLSITAGLPMPRVYVIHDAAPNAFATGRDPEHAAVAVTTGLLERLNRTELEGVIAHELSHIGNRDILLSTVVVVLVGLLSLISDFFVRTSFWGGGDRDRGQAGGVIALIGVLLIVLSPIIASLIRLAISRKREFLADASGALLTRYPEGLASALLKISAYDGKLKSATHATAHLFIANPFGGESGKTSFLTKLFMTHPPVEERVQALRGNEMQKNFQ